MNHIFLIKKYLMIKDSNDHIPYHEQYLTYEFIQGDVTIHVDTNANTITYYKIDDGDWQKLNMEPSGGSELLNLVEGQKIQFAANALDLNWKIDFYFDDSSTQTPLYNIYGNYMSIIYADTSALSNLNYTNFSTKKEFPQIPTDANGDPLYDISINIIDPAVYNAKNLILPATTLIDSCYKYMFFNCTSLVAAPVLPATTLATSCYADMFTNCTSLVTVPELPATTLTNECYADMFTNCTSLTKAPDLPATTLADWCYSGMFRGCTSLTKAPDLPATTLVDYCYEYMFHDCENLNRIKMLATDISAENCLDKWVAGVATEGKFTKSSDAPEIEIGNSGIPYGWEVITYPDVNDKDYLKFEALTDVVIKIEESGSGDKTSNISYSYDKGIWHEWDYKNESIELSLGEYVYLKGNNPNGLNKSYVGEYSRDENGDIMYDVIIWSRHGGNENGNKRFIITGKNGENNSRVKASGNIMSLLYNDNFENNTATLPYYCFSGLFYGCSSLITAPELPATKLADYCYHSIFAGCKSLVTAPELPATKLTDYCYDCMFADCSSLVTAPELLATTLAKGCYRGMFTDCKKLQNPPVLPATTLADECYQSMFSGCTLLQTAPELPATTLAEYCYSSMFRNCYNLNYIKMLATDISAVNCLDNWVAEVAINGIFIKHPNMNSLPTGRDGIPDGWDVEVI